MLWSTTHTGSLDNTFSRFHPLSPFFPALANIGSDVSSVITDEIITLRPWGNRDVHKPEFFTHEPWSFRVFAESVQSFVEFGSCYVLLVLLLRLEQPVKLKRLTLVELIFAKKDMRLYRRNNGFANKIHPNTSSSTLEGVLGKKGGSMLGIGVFYEFADDE